ncbi:MAG TPA: phosphate ABC transporter permease subunit PstC, partial [Candidatus Angelobacter sp.]|nr:phosphate ABC transporter permease subunit PstC [Candidatus Angelobacter sp.]
MMSEVNLAVLVPDPPRLELVPPLPRKPAPSSRVADSVFHIAMFACGLSVLLIVGLIAVELVLQSRPTLAQFGWKFFTGQNWDPVSGDFGALPFIYGTLVSSAIALLLAIPLSIGVAVFITEMCPRALRGILSFLVELLAAIPSVIYGLWAVFVLAPLLRTVVEPRLAKYFGWTGLFDGPAFGIGMLA